MKKLIFSLVAILGIVAVAVHFIPQEKRPAILRCSGCWYGDEYICGDRFLEGGMPPNEDGTCRRNFML